MKLHYRKKASGFSLLELLVVVGIISIVSTMSIVVLKGSRDALTLASARQEVKGVLELARAESIKRDINTEVTLINSGNYIYQFSITGTIANATHSLPSGVGFQFPAGIQNLKVTFTPSGKATMKGNLNATLYREFSFVSSAGTKKLTISPAGDISESQ